MTHIFKIVIISKDRDLNLINCFIYEGINLSDLKNREKYDFASNVAVFASKYSRLIFSESASSV